MTRKTDTQWYWRKIWQYMAKALKFCIPFAREDSLLRIYPEKIQNGL